MVVVVITCNHCPVAVAYEDRIIDFTKKYAGGQQGGRRRHQRQQPRSRQAAQDEGAGQGEGLQLPLPVRRKPEDRPRPRRHGHPEFFVLNKDRKVVYRAPWTTTTTPKAKTNYLEAAVEAALKGENAATTETKARGCSVKYDSKVPSR